MIGLQTGIARPHPPSFPGMCPWYVTPTRTAAVSVSRFAPKHVGDGITISTSREDAFVLLFQLAEHYPHDCWVEGKLQTAEASPRGTLFIADLSAALRADIVKPSDKLVFHLPRAALDEIAEDAGAPKVPTLEAPDGWQTRDTVVERLQDLFVNALAEPELSNRLLIDHIMLGLNAHFAHAYGGMRPRKKLRRGGLAPWQERRAKEMLALNLSGDISLQDVAAECGLSLTHFSRAFKRSTGMPPHAWLQRRRVEQAKDMLVVSKSSLAEIALSCGFADQSHFTRMFARTIGIAPGRWRRLQE